MAGNGIEKFLTGTAGILDAPAAVQLQTQRIDLSIHHIINGVKPILFFHTVRAVTALNGNGSAHHSGIVKDLHSRQACAHAVPPPQLAEGHHTVKQAGFAVTGNDDAIAVDGDTIGFMAVGDIRSGLLQNQLHRNTAFCNRVFATAAGQVCLQLVDSSFDHLMLRLRDRQVEGRLIGQLQACSFGKFHFLGTRNDPGNDRLFFVFFECHSM